MQIPLFIIIDGNVMQGVLYIKALWETKRYPDSNVGPTLAQRRPVLSSRR